MNKKEQLDNTAMADVNLKRKKRVIIFTEHDYTWAFPLWVRSLPEFDKKYHLVALFLFPETLSTLRGVEVPKWYLKVFGLWNFLLLSLYSLKVRLLNLKFKTRTWQKLASRYGMEFITAESPNAQNVCDWVRNNDIDIIFITVGAILKGDILKSPNLGIINKHAALLPNCKGLLPFFWAKLTESPTGITFHKVDEGIDEGKVLVQIRYPYHPSVQMSMLRYYMDVFYLFPYLALIAADRLEEGAYERDSQDCGSYFGLPEKKDYLRFRDRGHKVARLSDLLYRPVFDANEILRDATK